MEKRIAHSKGQIVIQVLIFGSIAIYFVGVFASWAASNIQASKQAFNREQAIQIAEAGIDYYRWHLAHAANDFQDGTTNPGPYIHDFRDKNGNVIGQFSLTITPPLLGSTLVTIRSTATVSTDQTFSRTIVTQLAKPSFAKYAVVANATMRFGSGTEVFGPIHSNGGIRFDGLAHNVITSAVANYNDPDHPGVNEFGVHTHVSPTDPLPPSSVPTRTDVFETGRQFPVPAIDFAGITADLSQMRTDAQANGFYRSGSGALGYHIVLDTDDRFTLYRVNSLVTTPPGGGASGCTTNPTAAIQLPAWGTWSIATTGGSETVLGTYDFPPNGIIFVEDNLWIDGQINTARLTAATGRFPDNPSTRTSITVNNDLLYTHYDGQDVIALIAQNNINVGLKSKDVMRIDAALMAQNGRAGRFYYNSNCGSGYARAQLTLFGMIGTNQRYGFAYTDGTGYQIRNINYDANLLYSPPPSFPLTSDQYITLSWEEE